MRPLYRNLHEAAGEPVQSPWPELDEFVSVCRGDGVTVLGAPMSNKSNLMLNWLIRAKVPTLFGTFDTPIRDMTARSLAIMTGDSIDTVSEGMVRGDYDKQAEQQQTLWFFDDNSCLQPDRNDRTLLHELSEAYDEFLGEPPQVIVLDNLSDCAEEVHHIELQKAFKQARDIGRSLNCVVFALHHVRRAGDEGRKDPAAVPVRLNDGVGAGERDAAVVLGLWKPKFGGGEVLRVAHLKSKRKAANPAGGLFRDFVLDQSRAWIGEALE